MKNKAALTSELARLKVTAKVSRNEDLLSEAATQSESEAATQSEWCHTVLFLKVKLSTFRNTWNKCSVCIKFCSD